MKQFILFNFLLFCGIVAYAQQPVKVEVAEADMSKGKQMTISVVVPEASPQQIIPVWERYVNKRSIGERLDNLGTQIGNIFRSEENKVKRNKLSTQKTEDEWSIHALQEPDLSKHNLDIYAKVNPISDGCHLNAFFQYSDSVFMNQSNISPEKLETIKAYVYDFGVEAYKTVVDEQISDAQKELAAQEKIAKKIQASSRKTEKSISGYQSDIQEYKIEIPGIENDTKRIESIIDTKKPTFSKMNKNSAGYDEMRSDIADFQRAKKNNSKKIKALNKKIKLREADIKSARRTIDKNEEQLNEQQKVIGGKELIVKQLQEKRDNIK